MYIICGLGNPGREYEATRHNMGFLTIDVLSSRLNIPVKTLKNKSLVGEGRILDHKLLLVKPQTFMNNSGEAVASVMNFYKEDISNLIIIYDDVDIEPGIIRIREKGSAGTHNGLRSVIYHLGECEFPRIRIGIGQNDTIPLEKYVLGRWTEEERPLLADAVLNAAMAAETILKSGVHEAMRLYNGMAPKVRAESES